MQPQRLGIVLAFACGSFAFGQAPTAPGVDRVLVFTHIAGNDGFQQAVNVIRVLANRAQTVPNFERKTLDVRGSADQVDLAEWLANQLDQPSPPAGPVEYRLPGGIEVARMLPLAHTHTAAGQQEIVNAIRVVTVAQQVMPFLVHWEIAIRGTVDQADMAAWLVNQLDAAPGTRLAPEYRPADRRSEVARVFFLAHGQSPQDLQSVVNAVRAKTAMKRIMPDPERLAIVTRGTEDQITAAAQLIAQLDVPAGAR